MKKLGDINTEKLAPIPISKKQQRHLRKVSYQTGTPVTKIIRDLIDKDMEANNGV